MELSEEQKRAYDHFIRCRNTVKIVQTRNNLKLPYVPFSDVLRCVDVPGLNHPMYEPYDLWLEYKAAFAAWLKVAPYRKTMSAIAGDYGKSDNWESKK